MTLKEKHDKIAELSGSIKAPWEVWTKLGAKEIEIFGTNILLNPEGDYATLSEAQTAVAWYVEQLGGSVSWKSKTKKGVK
jgi:hypothetical protein